MTALLKYCPQCSRPLVVGEHGGAQRLACTDAQCGYVHWDNPVPVVAAIVEHQGQVILARNALWPSGMFALITGFLEKDDPNPESGVLREVEEELGLKGRVAGFVGHYPFERMNQLIIAYHVVAEGEVVLGEELAEYKHVPFEQIRPWPAGTGYAVRDWLLRQGITPLPFDRRFLARIRNFRAIDTNLLTAGQPTAEELTAVSACGVDTVINLALSTSDHALANERAVVEKLGMRYLHIPVEWEQPRRQDLLQFSAAMAAERAAGRSVFVHCAANKRVSSFVMLDRALHLGVPLDEAERDLHAIWQPDPIWASFIQAQLAAARPVANN
ncbi:MAG: hypothetical protein JWR16_745 [Nevskia sp.]|nr:hypothetical protein [Nevskia sp.]